MLRQRRWVSSGRDKKAAPRRPSALTPTPIETITNTFSHVRTRRSPPAAINLLGGIDVKTKALGVIRARRKGSAPGDPGAGARAGKGREVTGPARAPGRPLTEAVGFRGSGQGGASACLAGRWGHDLARNAGDEGSRIARMKDATTHLAYQAEHVVGLASEFVLAAGPTRRTKPARPRWWIACCGS
jgi:hypothetical protein